MQHRDIARGLAWFGIGLGLAELLAPRAVGRATGLTGHESLLRVFGVREIASGIAILNAEQPERWLWTRVLGDLMDGALLAGAMARDNPERAHAVMATMAVAPVVALDVIYAQGSPAREETA